LTRALKKKLCNKKTSYSKASFLKLKGVFCF
jgi:hypothetical protein